MSSNSVESGKLNKKDSVILMLDSEANESTISIKDIIYSVLRKAGIMLIAGVVLGGALFSYKVVQGVKTNDVLDVSTRLSDNETDVQYQLRVQNIERARDIKQTIDRVNDQIEHQRKYVSDSIYMQIDAENEYQSTAQIVLSLENNDVNGLDNALFTAYEREIKSGSFLNDYAEEIKTKPDYIKELITFTYSPTNTSIISLDKDTDRAGSMYINIIGPNQEFVDKTMSLVLEDIDNVYTNLNSSIASHKITVVGIQQFVKIDSATRDGQANQTARLETLQKQIVTYNESLDKIAADLGLSDKEVILVYFASHSEMTFDNDGVPIETSEANLSRVSMIKPGIKLGLIGFCGGVFLVAVYIIVSYIFSKKIVSQAHFFGVFPMIKKIGVLKPSEKRSKYIKYLDIKSEDDSQLSLENNAKLISANYSNIIRDYSKVLITGTGDKKVMSEVVKSLGLKGDFKPDIFNNPDVLSSVPEYDGVVIMEQRKVSTIKGVKSEIDLISNSGTLIIGAIII